MDRIYNKLVADHLKRYSQMIFLVGPRQVGKTTISKHCKSLSDEYVYLNWDFEDDRMLLLDGQSKVAEKYELNEALAKKKILAVDEIHKSPNWRNYLKGLYDKYNETTNFIVTGSARLDAFRMTGDSLMGRYFSYHVHPFSIRELVDCSLPESDLRMPVKVDVKLLDALLRYGGFPAPFLKQDEQFYNRWIRLRSEQLFQDDIRDMTRIHDIARLRILAQMLKGQVGQLLNYAELSKKVMVTVDTIKSWINTLEATYYCFLIRPWSKNISRALVKSPKLYLWDWSELSDVGARHENFVASHLKKAVDYWTDSGLGSYDLYYVRDREKNEVDFLITKNNEPWILLEVKSSEKTISKSLYKFQSQLKAKHALQVVINLPFVEKDCFSYTQPVVVPALTVLSQLI